MADTKTWRDGLSRSTMVRWITILFALLTPLTSPEETKKLQSYQDILNNPTLCDFEKSNRHNMDSPTRKICSEFSKSKLNGAVEAVLKESPNLVGHPNALMATGDFVLHEGINPYRQSPMLIRFEANDIPNGCKAFVGYRVHGTFKKKPFLLDCHAVSSAQGLQWRCEIPSLVKQRIKEREMCLGAYQGV